MGNQQHVVDVKLVVRDDGSVALGKVGKAGERTSRDLDKLDKNVKGLTASFGGLKSIAAPVIGLLTAGAAIRGLQYLGSNFVNTAKNIDSMKVRLKVLLGDVKEANKLFDDLAVYAGRVPFELQAIMNSATTLAGIMKGGRTDVMKWMPLIGDLAAAIGLGVEETTEQVMRMLSAGAASADRFRERGVLAMLGFQAGVSYSADETAKKLWKAWESSESKFRGSTDDLAKTWEGTMSMFGDAWFQFNRAISEAGAWDSMTDAAKDLLSWVIKLKEEGTLDRWARDVSDAIEGSVDSIRTLAEITGDVYGFFKALGELGEIEIGPIKFDWAEKLTVGRGMVSGNMTESLVNAVLAKINQKTKEGTGLGWDERWSTMMGKIAPGYQDYSTPMDVKRATGGGTLGMVQPMTALGAIGGSTKYTGPAQSMEEEIELVTKLLEIEEQVEAVKKRRKEAERAAADATKEQIKIEEQYRKDQIEAENIITEKTLGKYEMEKQKLHEWLELKVAAAEAAGECDEKYYQAFNLLMADLAQTQLASLEEVDTKAKEVVEGMKALAEDAGSGMLDSMGNFVTGAARGFDDMGSAFSNMVQGMIQDLAQLAMQSMVLQPLKDMMGGLFSGGGAAGGIFGSIKDIFSGIFHDGGVVQKTGLGLLEKGEVVIPRYASGGYVGEIPSGWDWYRDDLTGWGKLPSTLSPFMGEPSIIPPAGTLPKDILSSMGYDPWFQEGEGLSLPVPAALPQYGPSIWDMPRVTQPMMDLFGTWGLMPETNWGLPYYYFDQFGSFAEPLAALSLMTGVDVADLMANETIAKMVSGRGSTAMPEMSNMKLFNEWLESGKGLSDWNQFLTDDTTGTVASAQDILAIALQGLHFGLGMRGTLGPESLLYGPDFWPIVQRLQSEYAEMLSGEFLAKDMASMQKTTDYRAMAYSRAAWDYLISGMMYSLTGGVKPAGLSTGLGTMGGLTTATPGAVGFPGWGGYEKTPASALEAHSMFRKTMIIPEPPPGYVPSLPAPWFPEDPEKPHVEPVPEEPWVPIPPTPPPTPPPGPGPVAPPPDFSGYAFGKAYALVDGVAMPFDEAREKMLNGEIYYTGMASHGYLIFKSGSGPAPSVMRGTGPGASTPYSYNPYSGGVYPSYGFGGMAWNEHLAVLHAGEAVIPANAVRQNRQLIQSLIDGPMDTVGGIPSFARGGIMGGGGGGGKITINIINQSGINLEAEEQDTFYQFEEMVKTVVLRAAKQDPKFAGFGG